MRFLLIRLFACLSVALTLVALAACGAPPTSAPAPTTSAATAVPPTVPPLPTLTPVPAKPSPTPLPSNTPVPTPVPGGLYVDPGTSLGPISRFSYGTNYGPWGIIPVELYEAYDQSGLTFIRFPGGNFGDENDLTTDQVDQFVKMARSINAEPQISVRLKGGDPAKAAALVKHTVSKGYNLKYWSIGNEPNLYDTKGGTWPIDRYNKEWRAIAEAMRAVDPSIELIGPEIHQFYPNPPSSGPDAEARETLKQFLKVNGDLVDVVSVHRYPFPKQNGEGPPTAETLLANSKEWDQIIPELRAVIRESAGRDLPVAVTEFNSTWANWCCRDTTPDSTVGGLWLGDVLGRMIRQKVDIIAQFCLRHTTSGLGIMGSYDPNPAYYVYQLYKQFGSELIYSSSDDDKVTIYSARREDGTLTLMILNLTDKETSKTLMLKGVDSSRDAEVWRFDAKHKADKVGTEKIANNAKLTLPAYSMSLYIVPGK